MINKHKPKTIFDLAKVEETYNVKYVGDFCMKAVDGSWANFPVAIFYGEKHPQGSNYMALFDCPVRNCATIMDGLPAVTEPFTGIYNPETDEFTYSAFRHDFQTLESNNGNVSIDGGRDYVKLVGDLKTSNIQQVQLKVLDGKIMLDNSGTLG